MNCPVCQSCGMPLHRPDMYGTDEDGSFIEEYCVYCYREGQFTSDVTMDEMIQLCAKYVNNISREQAVHNMKLQFPRLKRWAQKEETESEYYKSINKVLDYINEHLNEKPDLDTLSAIANISPYHFHRIFKGIIGENLGEYIQRVRLEYVAEKLKTSSLSLDLLAEQTGYNGRQAISKAFKKYFGIPPSVYKNNPDKGKNEKSDEINPRICKIASKKIIYIDTGGNITSQTYNKAWKELYMYTILKGLYSNTSESIGVSFEEPFGENKGNRSFYISVTTESETASTDRFICRTVEGGLYAIFTHQGAYEGLTDLYKTIWFEWFPTSKYKIRKGVFFEKYLNNPDLIQEEDILTEVYVPIDTK